MKHKTNGEYVDLRDICYRAIEDGFNLHERGGILEDIIYHVMGDLPLTTDQLREKVVQILNIDTTNA